VRVWKSAPITGCARADESAVMHEAAEAAVATACFRLTEVISSS
jgi:hypothetical protein